MKIKITKNKNLIKEEKQQLKENPALARLAPAIIKGVGKLLGGVFGDDDAEEIAKEIIDQSQTDPIVMKGQDLSDIEAVLRSIESQISSMSAARGEAEGEADRAAIAPGAPAEPGAEKAAGGMVPGPAGTKVKNPKLARVVGPASPLATGGDVMQSSRNIATLGKKAGIGSKKGKRG